MIYLDANATEPLRPEAQAAALAAMALPGNPASIHTAGRAARAMLEAARTIIAGRVGAKPADLVFTSGGTEANALALHALGAGRRIITSAVEHDSIRAATPGATVLAVRPDGQADLDHLAALLADNTPALVCLMLANNETGTLQPVRQAAALCRRHDALLHVDAVQAFGRIPVDLPMLGAHSLALSAHKLGGLKGAGALITLPEISIPPLIAGGGQERGRRGGTPPLPAIASFGAAAEAAGAGDALAPLRDALEQAARHAGAVICGGDAPRLPNTTCLALPGVRADTQVIALDLAGIQVSAGAACSSGKVAASHVLAAMGLGALAGQAIRVSLPWNAGQADAGPAGVDAFITAYAAMAARLSPRAG